MSLDKVGSGSKVFVDANIFIYHFTGVSSQCSNFLGRCEQGDLEGVTSVIVILEVLHRLMMVEAAKERLVTPPNMARKLQKSPKKVMKLNEYFWNTRKIAEMGIRIKPLSFETVLRSQDIREKFGLMVNDSLIVASMEEENISPLATNDGGFLKIKSISVHQPTDLSR